MIRNGEIRRCVKRADLRGEALAAKDLHSLHEDFVAVRATVPRHR
jgi:hypothetical protein